MRKERYKFIKPSVLVVVKTFTYLKEQGRPEMKTCSSYLKKCVLAAFRNLSQSTGVRKNWKLPLVTFTLLSGTLTAAEAV